MEALGDLGPNISRKFPLLVVMTPLQLLDYLEPQPLFVILKVSGKARESTESQQGSIARPQMKNLNY